MDNYLFKRYPQRKGFTLIELLVVIGIIGILSAVVLATLSTSREKGRDAKRFSDIRELQKALELEYTDSNKYIKSPKVGPPSWVNSCDNLSDPEGWIRAIVQNNHVPSLPTDPVNTQTLCYYYCGSGDQDFKLAIHFERSENQTALAATDGGVLSEWYEVFTPDAALWNWNSESRCNNP